MITPGDRPWALLQLPFRPPRNYTLRVVAQRKSGIDALVFSLVVGGSECNLCLDGWPVGDAIHTGLELIGGKSPVMNPTGHRGRLLPLGKRVAIECRVQGDRVTLTCDGQTIFDWRGDPQRFSMQSGWHRPDRTVLAVGSYNARFELEHFTVGCSPHRS